MNSERQWVVQVATQSRKQEQAHSDRCRARIEERLRTTPQGAESFDRRNEVINEALAKDVQRREEKRRRSVLLTRNA